jgi:hypothetical protein
MVTKRACVPKGAKIEKIGSYERLKWLKSPRVIGKQYKLTTVFLLAKFHQKTKLKVKNKKGYFGGFQFSKGRKNRVKSCQICYIWFSSCIQTYRRMNIFGL